MKRLRLCWLILRGRPVAYRLDVNGTLLMSPGEVHPVESSIYPRRVSQGLDVEQSEHGVYVHIGARRARVAGTRSVHSRVNLDFNAPGELTGVEVLG